MRKSADPPSAAAARVWNLLESLAKQVIGDDQDAEVTERVVQRCQHSMARANTVDVELEHAIRGRIRHKLNTLHAQSGDMSVPIAFDRLCEKLRHMDKRQRTSVLELFDELTNAGTAPHLDLHLSFPSSGRALYGRPDARASDALAPAPAPMTISLEKEAQRAASKLTQEEAVTESEHDRIINRETELELLRDVLYVFQGIDGRYIRFSTETQSYAFSDIMRLPIALQDMILQMCELGWLFQRVQEYIRRSEAVELVGMVAQAFGFALQEELNDYYRLLAVVESQLSGPSTSHSLTRSSSQGEDELTLLRLFVWMQDPIERMCLIATLTDIAGDCKGGALASSLHARTRHGDPYVSQFVRKLMSRVCAPIFQMVARWMFEGELDDPQQEFFVQSKEGVDNNTMWHERYTINNTMLPRFIPRPLANQILVIGKSINFLRHCCGDMEAPQALAEARPASFDSGFQALQYGRDIHLENLVKDIGSVTDRRLMNAITEKFKLPVHLRALKKFMLLGQGDFITCLMDNLGPELQKSADHLTRYKHRLTSTVEGALRSSNAQYEDPEVLDRIGVQLLGG
jgi:gamma-tubulin complex component 3